MLSESRRRGVSVLSLGATLLFVTLHLSEQNATKLNTAPFQVIKGDCKVSGTHFNSTGGACVSSPHFPYQYQNNEECVIATNTQGLPLYVLRFETEAGYDFMWVNGQDFSGPYAAFLHGLVPHTVIAWSSDQIKVGWGWQMCVCALAPQIEEWINQIAFRYDRQRVSGVLEVLRSKRTLRSGLYEECKLIFDKHWRMRGLP
mgnify:CR=1 FL=1